MKSLKSIFETRNTSLSAGPEEDEQIRQSRPDDRPIRFAKCVLARVALWLTTGLTVYAQSDPWSNVANRMGVVFSGPIAKGFALVAIVVGGVELAMGDGSARRTVGGILFGLGMALGAANFISWLFS